MTRFLSFLLALAGVLGITSAALGSAPAHSAADSHAATPAYDHASPEAHPHASEPALASPEKPSSPKPGGGHEGTPNPIEHPPKEPDENPTEAKPHAVEIVHAEGESVDANDRNALAESLLRIALRKHENGLHDDARLSLYALLDLHPGETLEVEALQLLAASYRETDELPRAVAILERILQDYKNSRVTPDALLTAGRIYRELGAYKLAFARFYAVLNATLKLSANDLGHYQLIARTAQFEIAETHLATGRYEEASEFFRRLSLLDLAPEDRARAQFKTAYALFLAEEWENAGGALYRFLEVHPRSLDTAEAYYLLSFCYERAGRHEDSLRTALRLFDEEQARQSPDPMSWRYWQRRVGNHLANEFFQKGQMTYALQLYDQLAAITPEPEWRAPALYQVGLSAERLGHFEKAHHAYKDVIELAEQFPKLQEIGAMASWRQEHLAWTLDFEAQRRRVLGNARPQEEDPSVAIHEETPRQLGGFESDS